MPSMIESPSDRVPEKAPRWDLTGTEAWDSRKVFWWMLLLVWEYLGIYSTRITVAGILRSPQAREARPLGPPLQAPWMSSGPRKIIVKFYSIWTPFDIPFYKTQKQGKNRNRH